MSNLEALFLNIWENCGGYSLEREYRFDAKKKWRFDFAAPEYRVGFEIEGGIYNAGRHTRGKGYSGDCEKYNEAALQGWIIIRLTSDLIKPVYISNLINKLKGET